MRHRWRRGKPRLYDLSRQAAVQPSTAAIEPRFRFIRLQTFLRSRRDFGVTSTNSSSGMNSIACRVEIFVRDREWPHRKVDARMLVSFFSAQC